MAPIPLTLVGILPGHPLLGAFFTATSMIGFIAGAGINVRNSIILVDFIELRLRQGMAMGELGRFTARLAGEQGPLPKQSAETNSAPPCALPQEVGFRLLSWASAARQKGRMRPCDLSPKGGRDGLPGTVSTRHPSASAIIALSALSLGRKA